ncbi:MAG: BPSS1780 family membrane protein [Thermodesulfobacteriota bacterium]|nr:BPSS1780 family membrane protein [Thermodesulfobacteriota bacterium]
MSEDNCSLLFTGKIVDGMTMDTVHENLAALFKTDLEKIKKIFAADGAVVKKNTSRQTCQKMQQRILEAGAICKIEPEATEGAEDTEAMDAAPASEPAADTPPPTPETRPAANPYAAPTADLKKGTRHDSDRFIDPQRRPASHGASWFFQGVSLFFKRPFTWILTMICYCLVMLIQLIPFLGAIVISLVNPVFLGGIMIGARDLDKHNTLSVGHLFKGFKNNFGPLLLLGLLLLGVSAIVFIIGFGSIFATMGMSFMDFQSQSPAAPPNPLMIILMMLIIFSLFIPIMMAFWFAPALIVINHKTTFEAIALSFRACLKNILSFLVYGLVSLGVFTAVMVVISMIMGIFMATAISGNGGNLGGFAMVVPFLVMLPFMISILPIFMLSIYTSYKDIFYAGSKLSA